MHLTVYAKEDLFITIAELDFRLFILLIILIDALCRSLLSKYSHSLIVGRYCTWTEFPHDEGRTDWSFTQSTFTLYVMFQLHLLDIFITFRNNTEFRIVQICLQLKLTLTHIPLYKLHYLHVKTRAKTTKRLSEIEKRRSTNFIVAFSLFIRHRHFCAHCRTAFIPLTPNSAASFMGAKYPTSHTI